MTVSTSAIPRFLCIRQAHHISGSARRTLAVLALLALCSLPTLAQTSAAQHSDYDSHAMQLLNDMAEAYAHLSTLDQESAFSSSISPLPPPGVKPTEEEMAKLKAAEQD